MKARKQIVRHLTPAEEAKEMYIRLCLIGMDQDTALEKVSAHFGTKLTSEAISWKQ